MNIHTNKENTFVCQHKQVEFIVYVFCNNEELLVNSTVCVSFLYQTNKITRIRQTFCCCLDHSKLCHQQKPCRTFSVCQIVFGSASESLAVDVWLRADNLKITCLTLCV